MVHPILRGITPMILQWSYRSIPYNHTTRDDYQTILLAQSHESFLRPRNQSQLLNNYIIRQLHVWDAPCSSQWKHRLSTNQHSYLNRTSGRSSPKYLLRSYSLRSSYFTPMLKRWFMYWMKSCINRHNTSSQSIPITFFCILNDWFVSLVPFSFFVTKLFSWYTVKSVSVKRERTIRSSLHQTSHGANGFAWTVTLRIRMSCVGRYFSFTGTFSIAFSVSIPYITFPIAVSTMSNWGCLSYII